MKASGSSLPPPTNAEGSDKQRVAEAFLMSSCAGQFQHVLDGKGRFSLLLNVVLCGSSFLTLSPLSPVSPSDLRKLLPPAVLTETFVQTVAKTYHSQQGKIVTMDGAKVSRVDWSESGSPACLGNSHPTLSLSSALLQVLLHKLGEVKDQGYLDPKTKNILIVNALAEVCLDDLRTYQ